MENQLSIALVYALSFLLVAPPLVILAHHNGSDIHGSDIITTPETTPPETTPPETETTIPLPTPPTATPIETQPPPTIIGTPVPPQPETTTPPQPETTTPPQPETTTAPPTTETTQGNLTTPEENIPPEPAPSAAEVNGDAAEPEPTAGEPELPGESITEPITEPAQEPGGETVETTTTSEGESNNDGGENAPQPISIEAPPPDVGIGFTPAQQEAVNQVAEGITGSGPIPGDSVTASAAGISGGGDGGSSGVQGILLSLLTGTGQISPNNPLIRILGQGEASQSLVLKLAQSLLGLLRGNKVDPKRLLAAVAAYNALIKASSAEFLQNPPPELITIRAVLSELVNAAQSAQGQGGQSN